MVECTALEMRHRCKPIGGSNPSLSAKLAIQDGAQPSQDRRNSAGNSSFRCTSFHILAMCGKMMRGCVRG